jgi:hypothetical protein
LGPAAGHCDPLAGKALFDLHSPLIEVGERSSMKPGTAELLTVGVNDTVSVSALWENAQRAKACFVFAHGAGAGMRHAFLESVASELAARQVSTLRYQFPYMERGSRRPDSPALCHATVRAAVAEAAVRSSVPLIAGGKSFGGRMTSQAQALAPLPGIRGLAFLGFPLHPAKRPSSDRADHLFRIRVPMLFLQGTRDALADVDLLESLEKQLGQGASLEFFGDADHSFHVPARTGKTDPMILSELADALVKWIDSAVVT